MAEISNNVLAVLLLVAIVASTFSFMTAFSGQKGITGFASSGTGVTNVSISSTASITLLRNVTNFGTGALFINGSDITLTSNGNNSGGFNNGSEGNTTTDFNFMYGNDNDGEGRAYPFVVQNIGGNSVNVTIRSIFNATGGGTAYNFFNCSNSSTSPCASQPLLQYYTMNNESGSCTGGALGLQATWTNLTTPTQLDGTINVCDTLLATDASDEVRIHFKLKIPSNEPAGTKATTITVSATVPA